MKLIYALIVLTVVAVVLNKSGVKMPSWGASGAQVSVPAKSTTETYPMDTVYLQGQMILNFRIKQMLV
jgi:hypothetical protein